MVAQVVLDVVVQVLRAIELVGNVGDASEIMLRTFLVLGREGAVFFASAVEFVRRKRSLARYRRCGRLGSWLGATSASEDFVEIIAEAFLRMVVQVAGARSLQAIAVGADVVDLTAFLLRIGVLTGRLVQTVDGDLDGGSSRSRRFLGGGRFLASAGDDVLECFAALAIHIEVHVAGALEFGTETI